MITITSRVRNNELSQIRTINCNPARQYRSHGHPAKKNLVGPRMDATVAPTVPQCLNLGSAQGLRPHFQGQWRTLEEGIGGPIAVYR